MKKGLRQIDLAYFAGFFDGEGSITIHENCRPSPRGKSSNHTLQVSIGNTDPRVLRILQEEFGGSLVVRRVVKPNHRPIAQWIIRAALALPFLQAIAPYIRMKADVVRVAIRYQLTKGMNGPKPVSTRKLAWREKQRNRIRQLNAKSRIQDNGYGGKSNGVAKGAVPTDHAQSVRLRQGRES